MVDSHLYAAREFPSTNTMKFGFKMLSSVYGHPTNDTMLYAQAHYNTGTEFFYLQGKTGIAIADKLYVGPEVAYSGSWTYNQLRLGGHLTGYTFWGLSSGVALGYVRDSNYGAGFYTGLNLQTNF